MRTHLVVAGIIALAGTLPVAAATITIAANGSPAWVHVVGVFQQAILSAFLSCSLNRSIFRV
jgi:hypothetical protein